MARAIQQTSIDSYQQKQPTMGEDQQLVLIAINAQPDSTDAEITRFLGKEDPNFVRPRRYELEHELGLVERSGKKVCTITGRTALTWRVKK